MLLPYGKNSNNRTSGYDVGVAFASRVRLFCLFFCLKPGLRGSVFSVLSYPCIWVLPAYASRHDSWRGQLLVNRFSKIRIEVRSPTFGVICDARTIRDQSQPLSNINGNARVCRYHKNFPLIINPSEKPGGTPTHKATTGEGPAPARGERKRKRDPPPFLLVLH